MGRKKSTCGRCIGVAAIHVGACGSWRGFSRVEGYNLVLVLEVDGHEEAAPDSHAMRVDESVTKESGDGCINCRAISSQHITVMKDVMQSMKAWKSKFERATYTPICAQGSPSVATAALE